MCEQCETGATIWRNVLPGWCLIRANKDGDMMKAGEFGLLRCNNPDIVWTEAPQIEPGEDEDNQWKRWMATIRNDFAPALHVRPEVGWSLFEAAMKRGYAQANDGDLAPWLWNHLACHMKKNEGVFHGAENDAREQEVAEGHHL